MAKSSAAVKVQEASSEAVSKSETLYFSEGGSDKVYAAQLDPKDGGWVVNFQYGRRGSSLKAGSKTAQPVAWEKANKIYETLVGEKMAKGYTPSTTGQRFQDTSKAGRVTGLVPQLLNPIEEAEMERLLLDGEWVAQEKFDGERRLVILSQEGVVGTNRDGLSIAMASSLEEAMKDLSQHANIDLSLGRTVLDGEDLGDKGYAILDVLELNGECLRGKPLSLRLEILESLLRDAPSFIVPLVTARSASEKRELLAHLRQRTAEGIVFKRRSAAWNAGRPASQGSALKFKFVESATVVVRPGREGKRSVAICVVDDQGAEVPVGNVNIPANHSIPAEGTFVEVSYLYAYKGGSLFQPTYKGERSDKREADRVTSLKFKPE